MWIYTVDYHVLCEQHIEFTFISNHVLSFLAGAAVLQYPASGYSRSRADPHICIAAIILRREGPLPDNVHLLVLGGVVPLRQVREGQIGLVDSGAAQEATLSRLEHRLVLGDSHFAADAGVFLGTQAHALRREEVIITKLKLNYVGGNT